MSILHLKKHSSLLSYKEKKSGEAKKKKGASNNGQGNKREDRKEALRH